MTAGGGPRATSLPSMRRCRFPPRFSPGGTALALPSTIRIVGDPKRWDLAPVGAWLRPDPETRRVSDAGAFLFAFHERDGLPTTIRQRGFDCEHQDSRSGH